MIRPLKSHAMGRAQSQPLGQTEAAGTDSKALILYPDQDNARAQAKVHRALMETGDFRPAPAACPSYQRAFADAPTKPPTTDSDIGIPLA